MKIRITGFLFTVIAFLVLYCTAYAEENKIISLEEFIAKIEKSLPEIQSNYIDVMQAENEIKRAKSAGDTLLKGGGQAWSLTEYSGAADKGSSEGYNYYAGLSKKITQTGTNVSTSYNYSKNRYSSIGSSSEYSAYEPSFTVKISQPLLYNFFGKVDRFAENDAKMRLEISKLQLDENNKSAISGYKKLYYEWILKRRILSAIEESIENAKLFRDQTGRKFAAGLSDNDDYQKTVISVIDYENLYNEYFTGLKNIEHELSVYLGDSSLNPDHDVFLEKVMESEAFGFPEVDFKETRAASIAEGTMRNLVYSRGVYENRLLPEFNVFTEISQKNKLQENSYQMKDRDYTLGFEFTYSLGNNSAESDLKDVDLQIKALQLEYESIVNSYRKSLLKTSQTVSGIKERLKQKEKLLDALRLKLQAEKKKYSQARLNLSYIIDTENNIITERINLLSMEYELIALHIDYMDLVK